MKIPDEVMWVNMLQMCTKHVGVETYTKIQNIIDKYPQWFQQEHICRNIPQEVKDDFERESSVLRYSFYPRTEMDIKDGEGISGWIKRQPVDITPITEKSLKAALNYIFVEKPEKEKRYQKALEVLHNKHYKKYKYKFNRD